MHTRDRTNPAQQIIASVFNESANEENRSAFLRQYAHSFMIAEGDEIIHPEVALELANFARCYADNEKDQTAAIKTLETLFNKNRDRHPLLAADALLQAARSTNTVQFLQQVIDLADSVKDTMTSFKIYNQVVGTILPESREGNALRTKAAKSMLALAPRIWPANPFYVPARLSELALRQPALAKDIIPLWEQAIDSLGNRSPTAALQHIDTVLKSTTNKDLTRTAEKKRDIFETRSQKLNKEYKQRSARIRTSP